MFSGALRLGVRNVAAGRGAMAAVRSAAAAGTRAAPARCTPTAAAIQWQQRKSISACSVWRAKESDDDAFDLLMNSNGMEGPDSESIYYPPSLARVGEMAPPFEAPAVVGGKISNIDLDSYIGQWVVLFFYPKDFTFVCPTEIIAFSDRADEFEALNAAVVAVSTDTEECHLAWTRMPRKKGGLGHMQIPLVADTTKKIANQYGVLLPDEGIALRGLFLINPEGVIEQITINNLPVGRSVDETLRLLKAFQFHRDHGEVCPANWTPGERTMVPNPEDSMEYFAGVDEKETKANNSNVKSITSQDDYDTAIADNKPTVAYFMADWCGKCTQMSPFVDKLSNTYGNKVNFIKVNCTDDVGEGISATVGNEVLPVLRFYQEGQEIADHITGMKKRPVEDIIKTWC